MQCRIPEWRFFHGVSLLRVELFNFAKFFFGKGLPGAEELFDYSISVPNGAGMRDFVASVVEGAGYVVGNSPGR
jgi:hypothetical protein